MRLFPAVVLCLVCSPAFGQLSYISDERRVVVEIDRGYLDPETLEFRRELNRIERSPAEAAWEDVVTVSRPADERVGIAVSATAWQTSETSPSFIHATGGFRDILWAESPWSVRGVVESSLRIEFDVTRQTQVRIESELLHGRQRDMVQWYPDFGGVHYAITGEGVSHEGGPLAIGVTSRTDNVALAPGRYSLSILASNDLDSGTATAWPDASFDIRLETHQMPEPSALALLLLIPLAHLIRLLKARRSG